MIAAVMTTAAIAVPPPGSGSGGTLFANTEPSGNHRKGTETAAADTTELTASLITCFPGPEIYELCGHEALRIRGAGIDSVWNYGVFDFAEPNFVGRFVKGETDYMLAGYPFSLFMPEYRARGSKVVEQDLNLTAEETQRLLKLLQKESLPANCRYRYNYVRDNCATRIVDRLQQATGGKLLLSDSIRYSSLRDVMRNYHRNYPWYQFGIDLALGSGLDGDLKQGEQMFAPMEMMADVRNMRVGSDRPLIKAERVLYEGRGDVTESATPFWKTPMAVALYMLVVSLGICLWDAKRQTATRWWWSLYYLAAGLAGCVIFFLVFFSSHDSTSPNMMLLWLNPLQLIIGICVWIRRMRPVVTIMSWLNIIVGVLMLLAWPMQAQSANPAVFPMLACNLLLSATWATIAWKNRYNKEAVVEFKNSVSEKPKRGRAKTSANAAKSGSRKSPARKASRK